MSATFGNPHPGPHVKERFPATTSCSDIEDSSRKETLNGLDLF